MKKIIHNRKLSTTAWSVAVLYFLLIPFNSSSQTADDYFRKALLNDSLQNFNAALQFSNLAVTVNPGFASAHYLLGKTHYYLSNYYTAIKYETTAIHLKPANEKAYLIRAHAYEALHNYTAAIKDFTSAIAINPGNSASWFERGFAYRKQNNKKAARASFSKAIELGMKESGDLLTGREPE